MRYDELESRGAVVPDWARLKFGPDVVARDDETYVEEITGLKSGTSYQVDTVFYWLLLMVSLLLPKLLLVQRSRLETLLSLQVFVNFESPSGIQGDVDDTFFTTAEAC